MDTQHAVADTAPVEANADGVESRRDGSNKIMLGPGDSLDGKLTYNGHMTVQGQAQGEFRITGNFEVGDGATVKALVEGSNVTIKGDVEGMLTARDKLTLGKSAKLNGDVTVKRLQIEDGASFVMPGPRDRLIGELYTEGNLRFSGTIEGQIEATCDVDVTEAAMVKAT